MHIDVPIFAVRRSRLIVGWYRRQIPILARRWFVSLPCSKNRIIPHVEEPRGAAVIRSFRSWQSRVPKTRAEIGDIAWPRQELLEIADLLSRLDVRDIENFCLQRACLARELRRLAARRVAHT